MVYCTKCGKQIHETALYCPQCGAATLVARAQPSAPGGKDQTLAVVFALLLGGIGVHKFYLGKWVQGIFYLLFFWTVMPGIIAFIEAIIYLSLSEDEFHRRYP